MPRRWSNLLLLVFLVTFSSSLFPANFSNEVKQALAAVNKNFSTIKTIQGKLKRKITVADNEELAEGFFAQREPAGKVQRGPQVFLEYTTPPRQKVISNGQVLWIYAQEKNEVIELDNLTAEELASMQRFDIHYLLDVVAQSPAYTLKEFRREGNEVVLVATPKKVNPFVSKVLIKIDMTKGAILAYETFAPDDILTNQVKFEDYRVYPENIFYPKKVITSSILGPGQVMTQSTEFFRLKFNQTIADSRFQFTPPKGSKIIKRADLQERLNVR